MLLNWDDDNNDKQLCLRNLTKAEKFKRNKSLSINFVRKLIARKTLKPQMSPKVI